MWVILLIFVPVVFAWEVIQTINTTSVGGDRFGFITKVNGNKMGVMSENTLSMGKYTEESNPSIFVYDLVGDDWVLSSQFYIHSFPEIGAIRDFVVIEDHLFVMYCARNHSETVCNVHHFYFDGRIWEMIKVNGEDYIFKQRGNVALPTQVIPDPNPFIFARGDKLYVQCRIGRTQNIEELDYSCTDGFHGITVWRKSFESFSFTKHQEIDTRYDIFYERVQMVDDVLFFIAIFDNDLFFDTYESIGGVWFHLEEQVKFNTIDVALGENFLVSAESLFMSELLTYKLEDSRWVLQPNNLTASTTIEPGFIVIGNLLLVKTYPNGLYLYNRTGGDWIEQDQVPNNVSGYTVENFFDTQISHDNKIAISQSNYDSNKGSVFIMRIGQSSGSTMSPSVRPTMAPTLRPTLGSTSTSTSGSSSSKLSTVWVIVLSVFGGVVLGGILGRMTNRKRIETSTMKKIDVAF